MPRITPIKGTLIFLSSGLLWAYGYDYFECKNLHREALARCRQIGDHPLSSTDSSSKSAIPKVKIFYTATSPFYNQFIVENFKSYSSKYLTAAGVDYEMHRIILSKYIPNEAQISSVYSSPEAYMSTMRENQEIMHEYEKVFNPQKISTDIGDAEHGSSESNKMPIVCLNKSDFDCLPTRDFVISCDNNRGFINRIVYSFIKRKQLEEIIRGSLEVIQNVAPTSPPQSNM